MRLTVFILSYVFVILTAISAQESTGKLLSNDSEEETCFKLVQVKVSSLHQLRDVTNNMAALHEKELLLAIENKRLTEQLTEMQSEQKSLNEELQASQQLLNLVKNDSETREALLIESRKTIEKITQENIKLKHHIQESTSCKDAVLNKMTSLLETQKSSLTSEIQSGSNEFKTFINKLFLQDNNNKIDDINNIVQTFDLKLNNVLIEQSKLTDGIDQSMIEHKNFHEEIKRDLGKIMSKLEIHDAELQSHRHQSCEMPIGNLTITNINGKRYFFPTNQPKMSWNEADNFCKEHGMQLVSVESQHEWDALKPEVKKLTEKYGGVAPWSSGSDAAEEGKWKWVATGSDVTFYGRRPSTSNNTNANCLYLYHEFWNDFDCSAKQSFICEINTLC